MLFSQIEVPAGWSNISIDIDTMGLQFTYPLSKVVKTTDAHSGSYAARLDTKMLDSMIVMALQTMGVADVGMMPTIMSIGGINILPVATDLFGIMSNPNYESVLMQLMASADLSKYFKGGLPLNGFKVSALEGYYKYDCVSENAADEAMIMLIGSVYDVTSNRRTIAGVGVGLLDEKSEYEKFTIPYFALSAVPADTIEVVIFSSQLLTMELDSKLYVDDLSLVGQNGVVIPLMSSDVSCYPNPSKGNIILSLESDEPAEVTFYNVLGQKVLGQKSCIDGTKFTLPESGVYMMEVIQGKVRTTKTVVIN